MTRESGDCSGCAVLALFSSVHTAKFVRVQGVM